MFGRNKITSSRSKRTTRSMHSATLGSHASSRSAGSSRRSSSRSVGGTHQMGYANARRSRRAERGVVDYVRPTTRSGESMEQHSQRMGRRRFAQEAQRTSSRRRVLFLLCSLLLVVLVAVAAGIGAFFLSVNGKLSLGDSNADTVLVAPEKGATSYYVLCAAELGAAQGVHGDETDA